MNLVNYQTLSSEHLDTIVFENNNSNGEVILTILNKQYKNFSDKLLEYYVKNYYDNFANRIFRNFKNRLTIPQLITLMQGYRTGTTTIEGISERIEELEEKEQVDKN